MRTCPSCEVDLVPIYVFDRGAERNYGTGFQYTVDKPKVGGLTTAHPQNTEYIDGGKANMVNHNHPWVKAAHELGMPITAGISGTTNRLMNLAKQQGISLPSMRLACLGYLLPSGMHSFHEIMSAARRAGAPYTDGAYHPVDPLDADKLKKKIE